MSRNDSAPVDRSATAQTCPDGPISLPDVLKEEYEAIFGPYPPPATPGQNARTAAAAVAPAPVSDAGLPQVRKALNDTCAAALCLSGGGIRSATFALGIMQGLAKRGLLERFHYLSTVSGGGFIGSWLSAWIHNAEPGVDPLEILSRERAEVEPRPIRHLREFSNYLSPKMGLSSADTWALAFTFVRNLVLNWLVFVPPLIAVLMIPRLMVSAIASYQPAAGLMGPTVEWRMYLRVIVALLIAGITGWKALSYIALNRPSLRKKGKPGERESQIQPDERPKNEDAQSEFLRGCLVWLTLAVLALALAYAWSPAPSYIARESAQARELLEGKRTSSLWSVLFVGVAMSLNLIPWIVHVPRMVKDNLDKNAKQKAPRAAWELAVFALTGAVGGFLLWVMAAHAAWLDPVNHQRAYTVWAVPAMLGLFLLNLALSNGLLSIQSKDEDREWSARAGGWILMVILLWLAISIIVLFAPSWLLHYLSVSAPIGVLATGAAAYLGRSASTPATDEQAQRAGKAGLVKRVGLALAAPIAIVFLLIVLALGTDWLLERGGMLDARIERLLKGEAERDARLAILNRQEAIAIDAVQKRRDDRTDRKAQKVIVANPTHSVTSATVIRPAMTGSSVSFPLRQLDYHERIVKAAHWLHILIWGSALFFGGYVLSYWININKFSLQFSWRNRLMRAYLGASHRGRTTSSHYDRFTGFNPRDNINMWDLWYGPVTLLRCLVRNHEISDSPVKRILQYLPSTVQEALKNPAADWSEHLRTNAENVDRAITEFLRKDSPERSLVFDALKISAVDGLDLCGRSLIKKRRQFINVLCGTRKPFHVINMALNLVSGNDLAWQQRKAESFTASTLHCGSGSAQFPQVDTAAPPGAQVARLGYRSSSQYGGASRKLPFRSEPAVGNPISLGTAMGLSGAAVNPNMGSHSSPAVTFLLTLFNVRVGAWLGNPGEAGNKTYASPFPMPAFAPMFREAFGMSNDHSEYVMLSDGGHFENLGLYEMIRRQCRVVFVSDAGQDPPFTFDDLGNAVRKVYIDMGVPIDFDGGYLLRLRPRLRPDQKKEGAEHEPTSVRCALARIRYSALPTAPGTPRLRDGYLIYVKPTFYGDEPIDVYNFAKGSAEFPHETTADQFFSESQFESYRRLGEFIIDQLYKEGVASDDGLEGESFPILGQLDPDAFVDPHVFWVEPPTAKTHEVIKIRGLGFKAKTTVLIGGIAAIVQSVSADRTVIEVIVPERPMPANASPSEPLEVVVIPPAPAADADKVEPKRIRMRDAFSYS